MEGFKVFIWLPCFHIFVLQSCLSRGLLKEPDYVSDWHDMKAQAGITTTLLSIAHGLGETPLLVDVQVMVTSGDNEGYIFPGSGCRARDDDESEGYGGIIYIYNDVYIQISSPIKANHFLGRCVYTGKSPYWEGPYSTDSYSAKVRARAWKSSSLPPADFVKTGIPISSGGSYSYFEVDHDLGYTSLVISRTRFPTYLESYSNYLSDSVGASMGMYDSTSNQNSFVVYGFNDKTIRVWAPSAETDFIFAGTDGWNFDVVKNGTLELYAWKYSSFPPSIYWSLGLGRAQKSKDLQQSAVFEFTVGHFVKAWVQATSGINAGFRFVGNGNLAYDEVKTAEGCSYGGLLYAYNNHSIRFWQPGRGNGNSNGALICIANGMGRGKNIQASTEGEAIYFSWNFEANASITVSPPTTITPSSIVTPLSSIPEFSSVSPTSVSNTDASPTFSPSISFPTSPYSPSSYHSSLYQSRSTTSTTDIPPRTATTPLTTTSITSSVILHTSASTPPPMTASTSPETTETSSSTASSKTATTEPPATSTTLPVTTETSPPTVPTTTTTTESTTTSTTIPVTTETSPPTVPTTTTTTESTTTSTTLPVTTETSLSTVSSTTTTTESTTTSTTLPDTTETLPSTVPTTTTTTESSTSASQTIDTSASTVPQTTATTEPPATSTTLPVTTETSPSTVPTTTTTTESSTSASETIDTSASTVPQTTATTDSPSMSTISPESTETSASTAPPTSATTEPSTTNRTTPEITETSASTAPPTSATTAPSTTSRTSPEITETSASTAPPTSATTEPSTTSRTSPETTETSASTAPPTTATTDLPSMSTISPESTETSASTAPPTLATTEPSTTNRTTPEITETSASTAPPTSATTEPSTTSRTSPEITETSALTAPTTSATTEPSTTSRTSPETTETSASTAPPTLATTPSTTTGTTEISISTAPPTTATTEAQSTSTTSLETTETSASTSPTTASTTTTTSTQSPTTSTVLTESIETSTITSPTTTTESYSVSTSTEVTTESSTRVPLTADSTATTTQPSTTQTPDCGNPQVEFAVVEYNETSLGSVATYFCRPGYIGNGTVVCKANGKWTPAAKCVPVDCGFLQIKTNNSEEVKYIPKNSTIFGSLGLLQCKDGYSFSSESKTVTFICSEDGSWAGNLSIRCTSVSCGNPDTISNGIVIISKSSHSVRSVAGYRCNEGFLLEGRSSRVCQSSGRWSGTVPTCNKAPEKQTQPCEKSYDNRGLKWNETTPGQIRVILCSVYNPNQNLSGEVTRMCSTEGKWLLPHYNCIRKELEEIKEAVNIIKEKPTAEVVSNVLDQLSTITTKTDSNSTYSGELEAVTSTLDVIASINYTGIKLTENQTTSFFETTSNLLDTSNAESWQAIDGQSSTEEAPSGASKVLDVISSYTDAVSKSFNSTGGGNITVSLDNLLLEIRSLQVKEDIVFPLAESTQNVSSSLDLSKDSLKGSTTYSAVLYKNLTGMMSINTNFHGNDIELGSSVLSVKLDNWRNVDDFNITLTFQHFEADKDLIATCSFRNESGILWEKDGCSVKHTNTTVTICECKHLTNFAILMSPWTEDNVETEAIRIVSIVGCSVSMLCLIITILTHMCYWKYVKSDRVKILMNLCLALLISYGIFLGGVDRTSNKDVCTTVAVFLQYIYLVVFFLMLAEGVEISFVVLYVFTTKSRLKWILPCAWLLPAIIVGISLAITQTEGYGNDKSCWLSVNDGLIWAFVGPALLVILINVVLIVLVLKAIFRTKNLSQRSLKERTIVGVRCLCILLPLVGCTWVLGIFYVNEDLAWIQYVFAVFNGLQGFAIFVFHCVLNTQIKHAFERKRKHSSAATFTRSTSNPILIPRAKPSSSTSDLYHSINDSFQPETSFQQNRTVHERYQTFERLEMTHYPKTSYQYDEW